MAWRGDFKVVLGETLQEAAMIPLTPALRISACVAVLAAGLVCCRARHAATDTMGLACLMSEYNLSAAAARHTQPSKMVQGTIGTCSAGARLLADQQPSDEYAAGTAKALTQIVDALQRYEAAVQSGDGDAATSSIAAANSSARTLNDLRARHGDETWMVAG